MTIDVNKKNYIIQAIILISDIWHGDSSQTMKNCFRKCDFSEGS